MLLSYYTYFHTRNDTNKVFYVGKGKSNRAYEKGRNPHWNNVVAKHGYAVHLAMVGLSEAEAFEHEKLLILCFKDMGIQLVNMTDGGEGGAGHSVSEDTRRAISEAQKGRCFEPAHLAALSEAHKGYVMPEEQKQKIRTTVSSLTRTEEWKANISKAKKGIAQTDEAKRIRSETQREKWKDPSYKTRQLELQRLGSLRKKQNAA